MTKAVIDKDCVLGHFVAAMYTIAEIKNALVFKGGTCLRKCWFSEYRFSEDLDFTAQSKAFELTDEHLVHICDGENRYNFHNLYHITAGAMFHLGPDFQFRPSLLVTYSESLPPLTIA